MASRTQINWLEDWVAPGICLLARTSVQSRASLGTVQNKGAEECGIWACVHENEMALIDAPFSWEDSDQALSLIDGFIAQHRVRLKYIAATHLDANRAGGLTSVLNHYKRSTFVFPESWQVQWKNLSLDRQQFGFQQGLSKQWQDPQHQPYEYALETQLAGERLFFVEAPYRSLTDQLVVFRGAALHPSWQMPLSLDEPLPHLSTPIEAVKSTLTRMAQFEVQHRYGLHASVDANGNSPLQTDFQRRTLMAYLRMVKGVTSGT